jgi:hypothetical protein
MLAWLSVVMLAAAPVAVAAGAPVAQAPAEIVRPQELRPLPGGLDTVPVFNSNSPELVLEPGILLSTFPPGGMAHPEAHLDYALSGRFDVFAHHVARAPAPDDLTSLYLGIVVHNPGREPVTVTTLQGASYLSQPDAPFFAIDEFIEYLPWVPAFAGPGSRVAGDFLAGRSQSDRFPTQVIIPPGQSTLLMNEPIPVRTLEPPLNGRSTLIRLQSSGPVYVASLARYAPITWYGIERSPTLAEWEALLRASPVAGPRDRAPTPPGSTDAFIYGRVAGVAIGSQWQATLTDDDSPHLAIPAPDAAFSYGISTLYQGRLGTGQNQSAAMAVRYPDTAYAAHGNYGIQYSLTLPLHNPTPTPQRVTVALETPIKEDVLSTPGLRFVNSPTAPVFFRGPVRVSHRDETGRRRVRFIHLVQRRGQMGRPLVEVLIPPNQVQRVQVDLLYPADSTPPQVLTVQTLPSP